MMEFVWIKIYLNDLKHWEISLKYFLKVGFHHQLENLCSPKDYPNKQTHSPICKEIFFIWLWGSAKLFYGVD